MLVNVLDYEKATVYNFTVIASFIGGIESHVRVTVYAWNINDNNPYFINQAYSVTLNEYTLSGARVVRVLASDVDNKDSVRMSIASGNTNSLFSMNAASGEMMLAAQPYLYTENMYVLMITLNDTGGRLAATQASVTVHIQRITASKVGCSFYGAGGFVSKTLPENSPIGTVVAAIAGTPVTANRHMRCVPSGNIDNDETIRFLCKC